MHAFLATPEENDLPTGQTLIGTCLACELSTKKSDGFAGDI